MKMVSPPSASPPSAGTSDNPSLWRNTLREHGHIHGYHRQLDSRHGALFTEDDETLLVSFEEAGAMRRSSTGLPAALDVAGREGWSQLCLFSEGDTFFRSECVYSFIDDLIDDGFFDRFDRVVFTGAGSCGYAAAAYSVAAPGATVVLLRPLATLDPGRTEWDRRYRRLRRTDFRDRYGYAPDMLDAAGEAFVIYDPDVLEDAVHASLFARAEVSLLRCRWLGPALEKELAEMGVLSSVLEAAGKGVLDPARFFDLYRKRQEYRPYLRRILNRLHSQDRTGLCRHWANGIRARVSPTAKAGIVGR